MVSQEAWLSVMDIPIKTKIENLSANSCNKLFQQQEIRSADKNLGIGFTLPVSESTWIDYYNSELPVTQEPWLIHLEHNAANAQVLIWVDAALEYFVGHFPGQPLLPGVVQINWCLNIVKELFPNAGKDKFLGFSQLKFKAPILPGTITRLVLEKQADKINFQFVAPRTVHTQGVLLYHA